MRTIEERAKKLALEYADRESPVISPDNELIYTEEEINSLVFEDYCAGYMDAKKWIKLCDEFPTPDKNGEKILICRILNETQSNQNPSIFQTDKIHLCNPDETWWIEIPKSPTK